MTREQAREFLLSIDTETFVDWHNQMLIDPFSDFSYCTIEETDDDRFWEIVSSNLSVAEFCRLKVNWNDRKRYFIFTAFEVICFDTIEELFNKSKNDAEGIVECFLENEENNLKYIRERL